MASLMNIWSCISCSPFLHLSILWMVVSIHWTNSSTVAVLAVHSLLSFWALLLFRRSVFAPAGRFNSNHDTDVRASAYLNSFAISWTLLCFKRFGASWLRLEETQIFTKIPFMYTFKEWGSIKGIVQEKKKRMEFPLRTLWSSWSIYANHERRNRCVRSWDDPSTLMRDRERRPLNPCRVGFTAPRPCFLLL